jgi:vacuolar-type H+-ATPase subunit E/Vma4
VRRFFDHSATDAVSGGDPWGPVRSAALADAHAQADRLPDQARERSAAAVVAARQRADELREDSLVQARRAADADAQRVLSSARASARGLLLSARRDVYGAVVRDLTEQASSRRNDYQAATEQLIDDARRRLGEDVDISAAPDGGIIARVPGRQIDYSLSTQVGRCLAQLGDEVAALWS